MTVGGYLVEFDMSKGVLYEKGMAHHLQNSICFNGCAGYVEYRDQIPSGRCRYFVDVGLKSRNS